MKLPDIENMGSILPADAAYEKLGTALGDRRDGRVYVHDERIRMAIKVAIATRRPLLLRGDPGSGKSSLAPFVARALGFRFYSYTVSARTQARDLMWEFDALRRLSDAQVARATASDTSPVQRIENYVEPRALWWALDRASASRRGAPSERPIEPERAPKDPGIGGTQGGATVILIDEIDKADPDVPNNLLECLGSLQFTVAETGLTVTAEDAVRAGEQHAPLVIVTTNDERELPAAFLRRCAVLYLKRHDKSQLLEIARKHFGDVKNERLYEFVADQLIRLQTDAQEKAQRLPSTAEYLDAVKACRDICTDPENDASTWKLIEQLTLIKHNPFSPGGL